MYKRRRAGSKRNKLNRVSMGVYLYLRVSECASVEGQDRAKKVEQIE